jgi:hypothetical protein
VPDVDAASIEAGFIAAGMPNELAREVLEAFIQAKRRFYLNDFMPNAVEGGRFSEAVLRVMQWATTGGFTPLANPKFKADTVITTLAGLPSGSHSESIRLHIPRAVRVIYDIRNKRNTAHLSDGIDPNFQDASIVVAILGWVLAELVRLYHSVSANAAQVTIEALVSREVPLIQVFDGKPRLLKTVGASDHILILVYWAGENGVDRKELTKWLPKKMQANAVRTLNGLHEKHLVHFTDPIIRITLLGQLDVEARKLIAPL